MRHSSILASIIIISLFLVFSSGCTSKPADFLTGIVIDERNFNDSDTTGSAAVLYRSNAPFEVGFGIQTRMNVLITVNSIFPNRELLVITDGEYSAGQHSVPWEPTPDTPNGRLYYSLSGVVDGMAIAPIISNFYLVD